MKKQCFFKTAQGFLLCSSLLLSISSYGQYFNEVTKAVASDRGTMDYFGSSVSISGNYAIVGAYPEDEDASGGNTLSYAGSAYIFERDGSGNWNQAQKIVASDREYSDRFGASVSISGNYAIVGAVTESHDASGGNPLSRAGSAYIFKRDGSGNWSQVQKIVASDRAIDDLFGNSVAINGNYAIVGTGYEDEDASGGNTLSNAGSAYIFEKDGSGNWTQVQKIVASDRASNDLFGVSVSINGNYVIVGANSEDDDASGGNTLSDAGSAYIFERSAGGNWSQVQKIVASDRANDDWFGFSVSISSIYAIVGAYGEDEDILGGNTLNRAGSAYIFKREGSGNWNEIQKIVASDRGANDWFGNKVSVSGNYAIVGAYAEDEDAAGGNTLGDAGSAYVFEYSAPLPIELTSFHASLTEKNRVKLDWQTSSETNNDYFTVERSQSGLSWEDVAVIKGADQSSSLLNYTFTDHAPYKGLSYYRLKQTDFDGRYSYSHIVSININSPIYNIRVFPNPANARLFVTGNDSELKQIRIYNIIGEEVTDRIPVINCTAQKKILDLSGLNNGMYFIRTKTTTRKVYKQFHDSF